MIAAAYQRLSAAPRWLRLVLGLAGLSLVVAAAHTSGPSGRPSFARAYAMNLLHLPLYAAFALGVLLQFPQRARAAWAWCVVLTATLCAGYWDETQQLQIHHRGSSLADLGSDLLGGLILLATAAWAGGPAARRAGWNLAGCVAGGALFWGFVPASAGRIPLPSLLP